MNRDGEEDILLTIAWLVALYSVRFSEQGAIVTVTSSFRRAPTLDVDVDQFNPSPFVERALPDSHTHPSIRSERMIRAYIRY